MRVLVARLSMIQKSELLLRPHNSDRIYDNPVWYLAVGFMMGGFSEKELKYRLALAHKGEWKQL
jgi:hypothetical protein